MSDIKKIIEDSFTRYAGNVILNRAICDARDLLKPSARMLMYSQVFVTKNIPSKPFVKSARVVGDALGHFYEHGDSSCYSTYMRMSKPFAMRYPLEDCQGNNGTLNSTEDEASMRYTELRLTPLGYKLFEDIEKDNTDAWCYNFDETEKYPKVLPSKGYYNICNGTIGLGIALSSSIPQFNLREINDSLIKLLWNPELGFDEICVMPDFATGAVILNSKEVKESLKNGCGPAIKLRSVVDYDRKRKTLIVKELPYGLYTETLSGEIQALLEKYPNCGIENVNDASHKKADYEIYLSKEASPERVLKLLYKETSLQSFCSINMTVLEDGKKPKTLGLKELLLSHLTHEKEVYTRGFQFDLSKINTRIHIIEGLMKAYDVIDEVIHTIKSASSSSAASIALQKLLSIDESQAKAILDLKLSRLSKLDISKLGEEKKELEKEHERISAILADETLLKKEIEKGLREVAEKFGDARRTKILDISTEDSDAVEEKGIQISLTNKQAAIVTETTTLYTQKRGGVGAKTKLDKGEFVTQSISAKTTDSILLFSNLGNYFTLKGSSFELNEKSFLTNLLHLEKNEEIIALAAADNLASSILFVTKNGLVKKSSLSEYNTSKNRIIGAKAMVLDKDDTIISICFPKDERVGILSKNGMFLLTETSSIRETGRATKGICGMKQNDGDTVIAAHLVSTNTKSLVIGTTKGNGKNVSVNEILPQGRATKGIRIHKCDDGEELADFCPISDETEVILTSTSSTLRLTVSTIPKLTKTAQGSRIIKLSETQKLIGISSI